MKRTGNGFTLVEILAVIVLMTILAGAGGGIYIGTYQRRLLEKSASELMNAAKYARVVAIEKQKPCKMYLDLNEKPHRFYLARDIWDSQTGRVEETVIKNQFHRPGQLADNLEFESIIIKPNRIFFLEQNQANNDFIVFAPDGTADTALVQVGNGQRHYTLTISSATGRATLYFGAAEELEIKNDVIDLDEYR